MVCLPRFRRWLTLLLSLICATVLASPSPFGPPVSQGGDAPRSTTTSPATAPSSDKPSRSSASAVRAVKGDQVSLTTDDDQMIAGTYYPPAGRERKTAVPMAILLHMYDSDRSSFSPIVGPLHDAGFAVLAIDFRGHGASVGPLAMKLADRVKSRDPDFFRQMYRDVMAAYEWMRDRVETDPTRFALVGASVGCSVALDYAARDRSVDAIVCLTPGTDYLGLDSVSHIDKYGDRSLFLVASDTERSAADQLAELARRATVHIVKNPSALKPTQLHGTRMFGQVPGIEKRIVDYLKEAVGPPSDHLVVASIKGKVYYEPDSYAARRLKAGNLRWFSSPDEAAARGFRLPKSKK